MCYTQRYSVVSFLNIAKLAFVTTGVSVFRCSTGPHGARDREGAPGSRHVLNTAGPPPRVGQPLLSDTQRDAAQTGHSPHVGRIHSAPRSLSLSLSVALYLSLCLSFSGPFPFPLFPSLPLWLSPISALPLSLSLCHFLFLSSHSLI